MKFLHLGTASAILTMAGLALAAEPPVMNPGQLTERSLIDALVLPKAAAGPAPVEAASAGAAAVDADTAASGIPASRSRGFRPVSRPVAAVLPAPAGSPATNLRKAHILMTFETNSSVLTLETMRALDLLARAMTSSELDGMQFVVEGHADARGDAATNLVLSQKRADAVVDYLRHTHQVAIERLSATGKGASDPLNPQRLDAPENRRVTIVSRRP